MERQVLDLPSVEDRLLRWEAFQMPRVVLSPGGICLEDLWGRPRGYPLWGHKKGQNTGFAVVARRPVVKVLTRWRTSWNAGDLDWSSLTSNSCFWFPKDDNFRAFRIRVNKGKEMLAGWLCIHYFTVTCLLQKGLTAFACFFLYLRGKKTCVIQNPSI